MRHFNNIEMLSGYLKSNILGYCTLLMFMLGSCKKFVTLDSAPDNILSSEVFNNTGSANSAINGIYRMARNNVYTQATASFTTKAGLYSDEIYNPSPSFYYDQYKNNDLLPGMTDWSGYYNVIYSCNAAIEGLNSSKALTENIKQQYIGEALFVRALCYYFLVNQYGDIPLITGTDVNVSSQAARTKQEDIYRQLVLDLTTAQEKVAPDYSFSSGDRTRVNKTAVQALLARIYLYQKDFGNAEVASTAVIESGLYSLESISTPIYKKNNNEAIFQFANTNDDINQESMDFLISFPPALFLTESLAGSFEMNDQRKLYWLKPYDDNGTNRYIPYKFTETNAGSAELYTPLRLGEQYLIRAEARIQQNKVEDGVNDLNILRSRASLPAPDSLPQLSVSLTKENALLATEHERRIELCFDMGHRFFDIKRTNRIDAIMNLEKTGIWKSRSALFPVPLTDLQRNPSLQQNPGYE